MFAGGLSMGAGLVTRLAEEHQEVSGLILVNPALATRRRDAKFARYVTWAVRSQKGIGSDIKVGGVENGYDRTPMRSIAAEAAWLVPPPPQPETRSASAASSTGTATAVVRLDTCAGE